MDERMEQRQLVPGKHLARDHVGRVQRHPIRVEHRRPHPRHRARRCQQVISGLINGIGGAFQWVRNTISNLGSSLVGWAKGVLGIHSPSRIFRDEVGKWIPAGMAQGIDKASGLVADSIDGLTDMVPTVSLKTDTSRLETPLAYHGTVNGGRIAYTMDEQAGGYATKQDIIDAIDAALAAGITLNLNDRGGEVMAGKLAKPMSYELNSLAMRGR